MTMAGETLKTIIALGYHVGLADEDAVYKLRKFLTFETKRTEGYFFCFLFFFLFQKRHTWSTGSTAVLAPRS